MREQLEELVESLLYEGYALYPYTPTATKNATPTPFGIVYPPVYATECAGAHHRAQMACVAEPAPGARLTGHLWYLAPSGDGHEATAVTAQSGPVAIGERVSTELDGGRFTVRSDVGDDGRVWVRSCVHNTREVGSGLGRAEALAHSLISVHVVVELSAGRFLSPLETGHDSVNLWPVLATPADDAVLGAAIALPDHPQISPRSHGNLFDNTEIEEALVLHVHSLTDDEREQAALGDDPVINAMLERTLAISPEQIIALHSGLQMRQDG